MTQLGTVWKQTTPPQVLSVDKTCDVCEIFGHNEHHSRKMTRNGQSQIYASCTRCEYVSLILPHSLFTSEQIETMPIFRDNRCSACGGNGCELCVSTPCVRCRSYTAIEYHHWAPRHLFGDADEWPGSLLCRDCHRLWHATVTPNMAKRKAA